MKREEQAMQAACFKWFNLQYAAQAGRLYMNYNNPPNKVTGGILKSMGLLAGIADMSYLLPEGRTAFIELKSAKGVQSPSQKDFEARVLALGFDYHVARDVFDFMRIIHSYNAPPVQKIKTI
jgi:hypothetical protein